MIEPEAFEQRFVPLLRFVLLSTGSNRMRIKTTALILGLSLLGASAANAQLVRGVMTVTGAEMH